MRYNAGNLGQVGEFYELKVNDFFTSLNQPGNIYQKTSLSTCRILEWNHDDDNIMQELHQRFGGIAFDIPNCVCDVEDDHEILVYDGIDYALSPLPKSN